MKLVQRFVPKPWGQVGIPIPTDPGLQAERIGEVIFDTPEGPESAVLVKYLFTSERLSIQVHPNDAQAHASGLPSGKDEMWIVLHAEPDASIGLGLVRPTGADSLRAAIEGGAMEELVDWRQVRKGDVIYNKAGTIHAAGAGLVLLEVQQAADVTYRLYDFGRPRELHIDAGLAVAKGERHDESRDSRLADGDSRVLIDGPYFGAAWCVGRLPGDLPHGVEVWQVVAVEGDCTVAGDPLREGESAVCRSLADIDLPAGSTALLAWPSPSAGESAA